MDIGSVIDLVIEQKGWQMLSPSGSLEFPKSGIPDVIQTQPFPQNIQPVIWQSFSGSFVSGSSLIFDSASVDFSGPKGSVGTASFFRQNEWVMRIILLYDERENIIGSKRIFKP